MSPTQQESGNLSAKDKICFRGSNFNVYKTRIQAKLKAAGLWTTVLGHEDDDDEAEEKANKAFNVIIKPLDDDNVAYVCHLKLVSDVWALLTERYESRAYADVSHVIHCMHTTSYKPGTSMQRHLTELRGFQQKLMHMGSMVEDEMLGKVVLTSVKDAFPTTVEILRSREIKIPLEDGWLLLRPNVMFAPGFCKNLLALRVLLKEGYIVACWNAEKEILVNPTTDSQLYFGVRNGLFMLETSTLKPLPVEEANVITARQPIPKLVQWHRRFAHLNFGALKQAIANGVIIRPSLSDSDLKETFDCETCMLT
ncbi:hypothetical protein DYB25_012858 [Aphanomyces astaci]|uniref:GAG-pre-integrase domain-containing protein n=1 Tax=Aphanomyces astaci TaxID=112090 RepID=A0A397BAV2_APHAT|nr:hypothetical protein DYB25_012858 [Aphanomyces astaci]